MHGDASYIRHNSDTQQQQAPSLNSAPYQYGHGREKCTRIKCSDRSKYDVKEKPSNCGYNDQWWFPAAFIPCGDECRGAFCRCLQQYNNPGYRDIKKGKWK